MSKQDKKKEMSSSLWNILTNNLLVLYDCDFTRVMIMALPYAPYELFPGVWLMVKGFN
jgi:hypothetical protein